ncbi:reticulon-1-A [Eurytemora carolleeae]|uniref:reticulon-1-A n=1 Tax=Eurytemora carolleeae TaxID=1294199 RepID=UPI000C75B4CE|nr:reticulon-1-A [Eurytemora carolleeae]|eukprot:XP_023347381.1 reticulon-1-A-like [Eurytemora affinis]
MSLCSLVYWENPILSGAVFGSVLVSLISLCYYSLIYVVSNLCLLLLLGVGAVKLYTKGMVMLGKAEQGSDPLSAVSNLPVNIPTENLEAVSADLAAKLNVGVSELRRLFLVDNMLDTLKFGLSLWCLTYIGSWFNAITLIILAWIGVFSIPKAYLMNQDKVDEVLNKVKVQVDEIKTKIMGLIPVKAAEKTE